eukprot:s569_g19.t1
MNKARAMLDALMGPQRDQKKADNAEDWKDKSICKGYLIGFCPFDKSVVGGKRGIEPCDKIHSEVIREKFLATKDGKEGSDLRIKYEEYSIRDLEFCVQEAEAYGRREVERLRKEPRSKALPADVNQKISQMKRESTNLAQKANALEDCEARKKEELMKQSDDLLEEAKKYEKEEEEKVKANFRPLACEVCGTAYISNNEGEYEAHLRYKIHNSYAEIRARLKELKDKKAERDRILKEKKEEERKKKNEEYMKKVAEEEKAEQEADGDGEGSNRAKSKSKQQDLEVSKSRKSFNPGRCCKELAGQVAMQVCKDLRQAVVLFAGCSAVQETFANNCADGSMVYTLVPAGMPPKLRVGQAILTGGSIAEAQAVLLRVADIYIAFAGGPQVSEQAKIVYSRGAIVIPLCSGLSGSDSFPACVLKKPAFVREEPWALLTARSPQNREAVAKALTGVITSASQLRRHPDSGSGSYTGRQEKLRVERLALSTYAKGTPWLSHCLDGIGRPALEMAGDVISVVGPPVYSFYSGIFTIYKALPRDAATCLWGLGQCFFGGHYTAFFAAAESFKSAGGDQMLASLQDLQVDAVAVLQANADMEKDLGKPTSAWEKVQLVLCTVDPQRISDALGSLWTGYMGLVLALKYKFARTVAFAHSIGDHLRPLAAKALAPAALAVTPPEYRQWIEPSINLGCKAIATAAAWKLQRILSSVQTGIAGGLLVGRSAWSILLPALHRRGVVSKQSMEDSMADELIGWSLAISGMYYQIVQGGGAPLVLLPLTIVETWLQWSAEKNSAQRKSAPVQVPAGVKSTQRVALDSKPDAVEPHVESVEKQQDLPEESRDLDLDVRGQPECDAMRGGAACADGAEWTTRDDRETDHETVEDIEPNAQKGAEAPGPRAGSASAGWSQGKEAVQPAERQSVPKWMPTLRHLQTGGRMPGLRQRRGDLQ